MKKTILICLATLSLSACAEDTTTKNGINATTRQATDAWFIHRITSVYEKTKYGRTDCYVKGEFENKGDVALYLAQVKYRTVLIDNPPEGSVDNQSMIVEVAPEYGKPNLKPFRAGEIRPVELGPFYLPCEAFKEIKLVAFIAKAVNSDGSVKHRAVKDGAPALIIENTTSFKVTRDES